MRRSGPTANFLLFLVMLPKIRENAAIYGLSSVGHYKVTVEALRRKGPPWQCFKCQHYSHNSRSCLRDPVCVGKTKVYGTSLAKLAPNRRKPAKRPPCCHIYHVIVRHWITTFGDLSLKTRRSAKLSIEEALRQMSIMISNLTQMSSFMNRMMAMISTPTSSLKMKAPGATSN
ncbi:hypothetical protein AVEN_36014-1 [Araneus ventricosus]|uniref:CCHC-type domain-containing protein n=1 Tax=Araneus ventricosus TaxID=182803 RepID=A0A4Y2KHA4_ARAVE|nr:hypothetical protein AVEN_36014-1 [Araneus ventricosus]